MRANSLGTYRLLDMAVEVDAAMLFVSTSEIYGDPLVHPQPETYWGNVDPIGPRSCYDESKRFGEALVFAYRQETGVRANVVRFFNTYGPAMAPDDGRVVSNFVNQALAGRHLTIYGDGSQTRSFCYVDDLVEGLWLLSNSDVTDPVNIGNPEEMSMRQLATIIAEEIGDSGVDYFPLPESDPARRRPDITRARTLLGWEPSIGLAEGLVPTIHYFRSLIDA
jgi:dTDP-glucose 4,6-dehydratase